MSRLSASGLDKYKELRLHFELGEIDYFIKGKPDDTHLSRKGVKLVVRLALQTRENLARV